MPKFASIKNQKRVWFALTSIAIVLTATGPAYAQSTTATIPKCYHADLNLSTGPTQGAAGTFYTDVVFTNQSAHNCRISGYPKLALLDSHNAMIGSPAAQDAVYPYVSITLRPGQRAHAVMGLPDPSINPGACSTTTSKNLQATPFTLTNPLETPFAGQKWCPGFRVTRVQPGI